MGNRKWIVVAISAVVLVGGLAFVGGRYVQDHPHVPTADERVAACVDDAMTRMDDVDDVELLVAARARVQDACEERLG